MSDDLTGLGPRGFERMCQALATYVLGPALTASSQPAPHVSRTWEQEPARSAGWKRLAVLGRALGEFAYISFRARWNGARDALAALQADGTPRPDSTARGHSLDASAYLLAHEVAARLDQASPAFATAFRARVTLLDADKHERYVEELLQRTLGLRGTDFGPPEIRPLPTSA